MRRCRERRGGVGLFLLALASACGQAESSTLALPDAGAAAATPASAQTQGIGGDAGGGPSEASGACDSDGVALGYLTLSTPAEIEALAGCREVDGNLSVVSFAGIDTSPLGSLRRITGALAISSPDRTDEPRLLDGFGQLESVGGLSLSGLRLVDLSAFGRLRAIESPPDDGPVKTYGVPTGALSVTQCSGLTSLAGLAALERVDTILLSELPDLTQVTGLDALRALASFASYDCPLRDLAGLDGVDLGALDLRGSQVRDLSGLHMPGGGLSSALQLVANPALTSLGGWQAPAALFEIVLRGNGALVDLRGLEPLSSLYYATIDAEAALTSLAGLDGLIDVGGLNISANPRLQSLAGLGNALELGHVSLSANDSLAELGGLAPDAHIQSLTLRASPALADLSGIGTVHLGGLHIEEVPLLDLRGLEQATLSGGLALIGLPALTSLVGLPGATDWGDLSITVMDCPAFRELSALETVSDLGHLCLDGTDLADLDALEALRRLGRLTISNNARLTRIDGLGGLERLEWLELRHNTSLTELPAFARLELACSDCQSGILLDDNAALESIGPWPWLDASSFQVTSNPALVSISAPQLRASSLLEVVNNSSLVTLELPSLEGANMLVVTGNPALDDSGLASAAQGPAFANVKIGRNEGSTGPLTTCPWTNDAACDEPELCAPGTDALDCALDP